MGNWNSGRRKQPTALKLLRGNPGKRRLAPEQEPTPPAPDKTFDIPPPELDGNDRARAEWQRLAPLLRSCGLVSQAERSSLTALCLEWATYLDAQAVLQQARTHEGGDGRKKKTSMYRAIADRALSNCHWLWSELGLTPSGRAKVARLPSTTGRQAPPASKWAGVL
jgi:P27 family predicted phage terminase small subunit